jgi:hypothetical protein
MSTIDNSTALVKLGKDGADNVYPVYMSQVRRENPDWSFTDPQDEATLNELGYFAVYPVDKPEGDVVTEGAPIFEGGVWQQVWVARSFTEIETSSKLATAKSEAETLIEQRLASALEVGFPFDFIVDGGTVTEHVQLRGEDRTNVAGSGLKADRLKAAGVVDPILPMRTYENNTYMCTPEQMQLLSDQAYDAFLIFKKTAWDLKDAVTAAQTMDEMPVIPAQLELPHGWETMLSPAPAETM